MKKFICILFVLLGAEVAMATATAVEIPVEVFRKLDIFQHVYVDTAELTFRDELSQEDIYQVTYWVQDNCTSSRLEGVCKPITVCKYVLVDTLLNEFTNTEVDCSQDIEVVIGDPELIDEL